MNVSDCFTTTLYCLKYSKLFTRTSSNLNYSHKKRCMIIISVILLLIFLRNTLVYREAGCGDLADDIMSIISSLLTSVCMTAQTVEL